MAATKTAKPAAKAAKAEQPEKADGPRLQGNPAVEPRMLRPRAWVTDVVSASGGGVGTRTLTRLTAIR